MREIKFRAWDKKERRLYQPEDINVHFENYGSYWVGRYFEFDDSDNGFETLGDNKRVELLQYTGLKDKNGKEIYEGDIIRQSTGTLVVEYHEGAANFIFTKDPTDIDAKTFRASPYRNEREAEMNGREVIGNIYENQELLK